MKLLAKIIDIFPFGPNKFIDAVKEFEIWTKEELDYITEAKLTQEYNKSINTKREKHMFAPKVYTKYSSKRILTTEFIEGITVSKILIALRNNDTQVLNKLKQMGFSRKDVGLQIANDSLKQIYLKGFFHGDPHPANIVFTKDAKVAYIDFGICGRLTKAERTICLRYARCFWCGDFENAFDALVQLCDISKVKDMHTFKKEFIELFDSALTAHEHRRETNLFRGSNQIQETLRILQKYKATLPTNTMLYFRTLITLRNVVFFLYPEMETKEIIRQLKNISLLNVITEIPNFFSKENRNMYVAKLMNFVEKEITIDIL